MKTKIVLAPGFKSENMTAQTQQDFMKASKRELGVSWSEFAALAGFESRAFKAYRMRNTSKDFRVMPMFVREAVERALIDQRENRTKENFEFSKRMHEQQVVKPARRRALVEWLAAIAFIGWLVYITLRFPDLYIGQKTSLVQPPTIVAINAGM